MGYINPKSLPFCSIWDLHKELQNLTLTDILRPRNREKDSQWLLRRTKKLPKSSYILRRLFKLSQRDYRVIWRDMAKEHRQVVSILEAAANATDTITYDCLFNRAIRKMIAFLDHFATTVAPLSESEDNDFKTLMENFGAFVETVSIFYDCFDCEPRSDTLRVERDGSRMSFFRFEKNERPTPLSPSESIRRYNERYPNNPIPEIAPHDPHPLHVVCSEGATSPSHDEEYQGSEIPEELSHTTYDEEMSLYLHDGESEILGNALHTVYDDETASSSLYDRELEPEFMNLNEMDSWIEHDDPDPQESAFLPQDQPVSLFDAGNLLGILDTPFLGEYSIGSGFDSSFL